MLFTATPPHAGARALARTHFRDSPFSPESGSGCSPVHPWATSPSDRTHPETHGGHLGASPRDRHPTFVTFVLAFPRDTCLAQFAAPGWSEEEHTKTQSPSLSRLLRPLPSRACTRGHSTHGASASFLRDPTRRTQSPRSRGNATAHAPNSVD